MKSKTEAIRLIKKILLFAGAAFLIYKFYRCPFYLITGIPCPSCGMTRAVAAALHLDFKKAFEYHPLFLLLAADSAYFLLHWLFPNKIRLPKKAENAVLWATAAAVFAVWAVRLAAHSFPA